MDINENLHKETESLFYYKPGDLVVLRHEELNSPVMLVKDKISRQFRTESGEICNSFKGMKCMWFDKNNVLQEAIFSTKDLKFYDKK